jgi:hypothetical protein
MTIASEVGVKYVYYCPRLDELIIVFKTPKPPKRSSVSYTCALEFINYIHWPINIYPEELRLYRNDLSDFELATLHDTPGLQYIGIL